MLKVWRYPCQEIDNLGSHWWRNCAAFVRFVRNVERPTKNYRPRTGPWTAAAPRHRQLLQYKMELDRETQHAVGSCVILSIPRRRLETTTTTTTKHLALRHNRWRIHAYAAAYNGIIWTGGKLLKYIYCFNNFPSNFWSLTPCVKTT